MPIYSVPGLISIHAPREGSDVVQVRLVVIVPLISIHAPREGSDRSFCQPPDFAVQFLSTLPVRGATASAPCRRSG